MGKKLSFYGGVILLIAAIAMIAVEHTMIRHLKKELGQYGGGAVSVEGARLYFDGLSVERVTISDHLTLKNVLLGNKTIKHVETLEMNIPRGDDFLSKPLPFGLYDRLNIKFVTLHLPFFDDQLSLNGRLKAKQKSDGSTGYVLKFNSQKGDIHLKGEAVFDVAEQKISDMAITVEEGASRYDWLNAKRVTGWWDYKGATRQASGEITIGSLDYQGMIVNNVQLALEDKALTFAGDLPGKAGQIDGDLTWAGDAPALSITAKLDDLSVYDQGLNGEGDFQAKLTLDTHEVKTASFTGQGDVKGRLSLKGTTFDFDYTGKLQKQADTITATPDKCLNASVSLTRQGTILSIPKKQCLTLNTPVSLTGTSLDNPLQFKGQKIDYAVKHRWFSKTLYGSAGTVSGRVSGIDDIALDVQNASLQHSLIKAFSGDLRLGKALQAKSMTAQISLAGHPYDLNLNNKKTIVTDRKTGQKIAELTGDVKDGRYSGDFTFNGPLALLSPSVTAGQAFYNGSIGFNLSNPLAQIDGVGTLKISEGAFTKGDLMAEGVTASIETQALKPLQFKDDQTIAVKKGRFAGIDFDTATVEIDGRGQPLSGTLNAMDGVWEIGTETLISKSIPVQSVLTNTAFDGLSVSPETLAGVISFKIADGSPIFETGVFKARSTGRVSYDRNRRPQFLNTGYDYYDLQRMRDILSDFSFSEFAVPFDKDGAKGVYMRGVHPKYNNGKPIEFDLTVE